MTTAEIIQAAPQLAQELETYYARKQELLQTAEGKYVVIKGDQIFGIFESSSQAYIAGYRQFRPQAFLVRQIAEGEKIYSIGGSLLSPEGME